MSNRSANGRDPQPSPAVGGGEGKDPRAVTLELWSVGKGGKQMGMREGSG